MKYWFVIYLNGDSGCLWEMVSSRSDAEDKAKALVSKGFASKIIDIVESNLTIGKNLTTANDALSEPFGD